MTTQNGNSFAYDSNKTFEMNVFEQFGGLSRNDLFFIKEHAKHYEKITTGDKKHVFARAVSKLYRILFIESHKGDDLKKELASRFDPSKFLKKNKNFACLISGMYRYDLLNKKAFAEVKKLQLPKCSTDLLNKIGKVLYEYYTNGTDVYKFIKDEYKDHNIKLLTEYFKDLESKQKLNRDVALLLLTFLTDKFGVLMFDEYRDIRYKFKVRKDGGKKIDPPKNDKEDNSKADDTGTEHTISKEEQSFLDYLEITPEEAKKYENILEPKLKKLYDLKGLESGDLMDVKKLMSILDECKEKIKSVKESSEPKPISLFSSLISRGILGESKPKKDEPIEDSPKEVIDDKEFEPRRYKISEITSCADSTDDVETLEKLLLENDTKSMVEALNLSISSKDISRTTKTNLKALKFERVVTVKNLYNTICHLEPEKQLPYLNLFINVEDMVELYDKIADVAGKDKVVETLEKMLEAK